MKNIILVFALIGQHVVMFSQIFEASTPVTVAAGYGNYHPQIEILSDGQLGIIWTDAGAKNLYFAKSTAPETFSAPVQLNPVGTEVQAYNWSGPDISVWGSNVFVAYHDLGYETGHIYLVKSTDNGVTFGDTVRVDNFVDSYAQFPDVVAYNDTVYVAYMEHGFSTMDPQMVLSRSVDGGQTFEAFVDASTWVGEEACDCCQPDLVVDDEKIIIYYRQNASNLREVKGVVSYDRGVTFTQFISADESGWTIAACPSTGPDARFMVNGNAVCAYRTSIGGVPKLFLNEYDLTGDSTVNLIDIYTDGIANTGISFPQIFVEGSLIGIVWEGLGSGTDIFFNASNSGVTDLLPTNAINVSNISGSQSKPDIAILNGTFHVIYSELSGAQVKYVTINEVNTVGENQSENIRAYPNPANEYLNIDLSQSMVQSGTINIFDLTGRLVLSSEFAQPVNQISIADLVGGLYFVQIVGADDKIEFTFIKD